MRESVFLSPCTCSAACYNMMPFSMANGPSLPFRTASKFQRPSHQCTAANGRQPALPIATTLLKFVFVSRWSPHLPLPPLTSTLSPSHPPQHANKTATQRAVDLHNPLPAITHIPKHSRQSKIQSSGTVSNKYEWEPADSIKHVWFR
jgi:hypothetical protein